MYTSCAIILFGVFVLEIVRAQNHNEQESPIKFDTSNIANGQYSFQFITPVEEREESGNFDSNGDYVVKGFFSYINDLNKRVAYQYTADKNGYHVEPAQPQATPFDSEPSPPFVSAPPPPQIIAGLLG